MSKLSFSNNLSNAETNTEKGTFDNYLESASLYKQNANEAVVIVSSKPAYINKSENQIYIEDDSTKLDGNW